MDDPFASPQEVRVSLTVCVAIMHCSNTTHGSQSMPSDCRAPHLTIKPTTKTHKMHQSVIGYITIKILHISPFRSLDSHTFGVWLQITVHCSQGAFCTCQAIKHSTATVTLIFM